MMIETVGTATTPASKSTMTIPPAVLGVILDTSNPKQRDSLKALTQALTQVIPGPDILSLFLIATVNGQATPVGVVTAETFERQWKEVAWGTTPDVTPGLLAMQNIMQQYTKPNMPTPSFRTLLLTDSPPKDWDTFGKTLSSFGRTPVCIGVIGEGEEQGQLHASYIAAATHPHPLHLPLATVANIAHDADAKENARTLFYMLY